MSLKSQTANMKALTELLSNDLGYIWGEREIGPNGAKKQFHSKGRAFLSTLGKDLGFSEMKVTKNYGGIGVSGEITLKGMWDNGCGLYVELSQCLPNSCMMYRKISHMNDYSGGQNHFVTTSYLASGNYTGLISRLEYFKEDGNGLLAA